ncbi:MAG: hypothetical protein ACI4SD_07375 [Suilimivivens sp.]
MKKSKYFEKSLSQRVADGGMRYRELEGMGFGGRFETAVFHGAALDEPERILR